MHHNTVDTGDKKNLVEMETHLSNLQHSLYSFGLVAGKVELSMDLLCDSLPEIVCAFGCASVPARGFCKVAEIVLIGINHVIITGMDIAAHGKQYTR